MKTYQDYENEAVLNKLDDFRQRKAYGEVSVNFRNGEVYKIEVRETKMIDAKSGGNRSVYQEN